MNTTIDMMKIFTKNLQDRINAKLNAYVIVEYFASTDIVKVKAILNDVRFAKVYESGIYFAHNGKADYIYHNFLDSYRKHINRIYFKGC